jgi:hypothetical protein
MTAIVPGRRTHDHEGDLVVFLIGMRINRLRAVRDWLPVVRAMPAMLRELDADPDLGLLGYTLHMTPPRGATVVQYWRDRASLLRYAHASDQLHRPAWAEYNRRARRAGGTVGIWHETLEVPAGGLESVYVNMPVVGLGNAVGTKVLGSAAGRA